MSEDPKTMYPAEYKELERVIAMMGEDPKTTYPAEHKELDNICVDISEKQYEFLKILSTVLEGIATKYISS